MAEPEPLTEPQPDAEPDKEEPKHPLFEFDHEGAKNALFGREETVWNKGLLDQAFSYAGRSVIDHFTRDKEEKEPAPTPMSPALMQEIVDRYAAPAQEPEAEPTKLLEPER